MVPAWQHCLLPALLQALLPASVKGHGFLQDPPSRNYAAHLVGQDGNPQSYQSGGPGAVKDRSKGWWPSIADPDSHGLCGDPVQGGAWKDFKYQRYIASKPVQETFTAGSVVTFKVAVTAHHKGHYEFRICDRGLDSFDTALAAQECLNGTVLERADVLADCVANDARADCQPVHTDQKTRWYLPPPNHGTTEAGSDFQDSQAPSQVGETHTMRFKIPGTLNCRHCTLQWWWQTANSCLPDAEYFQYFKEMQRLGWSAEQWSPWSVASWATPENSCCKTGGPFAEEFWNCADIEVRPAGPGSPSPQPGPTPAPVQPQPLPEPEASVQPTPAPSPEPTPPSPEPAPEARVPAGECEDEELGAPWVPHKCGDFGDHPAWCERYAAFKAACCFCGGGKRGTTGGPVPSPIPTSEPSPAPRPPESMLAPAPPAPAPPVVAPVDSPATPSPAPRTRLDCSECKAKCVEACGNAWLETNQCWGEPRYIECKCGDGTRHSFAGCSCEHSTCPSQTNPPPSTQAPQPTTQPSHAPSAAPVPATPLPVPATQAPTPAPSPEPAPPPAPTPPPTGLAAAIFARLESSNGKGVFRYETASNVWAESDVYTWPDMVEAVKKMMLEGIGRMKLWMGEGVDEALRLKYSLVNIAAFLAQCMQETIRYNACDENNWSDGRVVAAHGGSDYSSTSACGQLHQSYQDYTCSAEEDELAGGKMACDVDPNMETRAQTQAKWYGAPPKLFCAPRSKVPHAPRWDHTGPWCPQPGGWGYEAPFPDDVPLDQYWDYVNQGGSCKDYQGVKTGGWTFSNGGCDGTTCPGSPAPLFGQPDGRTDVEGCCWWGRGVIQTTGVCNFGKLNYYMGKRAHDEGRAAIYPQIDFCKDPGSICSPDGPPELKWVAGFFYWMNSVQSYSSGGWDYKTKLMDWVDRGMPLSDKGFINGASGIVNRGCHNPPACGTGDLHAPLERANNFEAVLKAMNLVGQSLTEIGAAEVEAHPFVEVKLSETPRLRGAGRKRGLKGAVLFQQTQQLESTCEVDENEGEEEEEAVEL